MTGRSARVAGWGGRTPPHTHTRQSITVRRQTCSRSVRWSWGGGQIIRTERFMWGLVHGRCFIRVGGDFDEPGPTLGAGGM